MENQETILRLCQIQMIILFFVAPPSLSFAQQSTSASSYPNVQNNESNDDGGGETGTVAMLVIIVMCGVLFLGSFSLWIHCCCGDDDSPRRSSYSFRHPIIAILEQRGGHSFNTEGSVGRGGVGGGIDKAKIDALPKISCTAARKLGLVENGSGECAVCLSEFEEDDLLVLLPVCDHAFHRHCVGAWLANHRTCPICRADLAHSSTTSINKGKAKRMESNSSDSTNCAAYSSEDFEQIVLQLECGLRAAGAGAANQVESGPDIERRRTGDGAGPARSWSWRRLASGDSKAGDSVNPVTDGNIPLSILPYRELEKSKINNNNNVKLKRSVSLEALPRLSSSRRPQRATGDEEEGLAGACWPTGRSDRRASTSGSAARLGGLDLLEEGKGQGGMTKGLTRPPV